MLTKSMLKEKKVEHDINLFAAKLTAWFLWMMSAVHTGIFLGRLASPQEFGFPMMFVSFIVCVILFASARFMFRRIKDAEKNRNPGPP